MTSWPGKAGRNAFGTDTIPRRTTAIGVQAPVRRWGGILSYIRGLSISQWMLLLYPVVLALVARQREPGEAFLVDRSAMVQVAFTAVCGVYVCVLLWGRSRGCRTVLFRRPMVWLFLYGVLGMVSATWSGRPDFTLYRAAELTIFLVLSVDAMIRAFEPAAMIKFQMVFATVAIALGAFVPSRLNMAAMHSSEVPGAVVAMVFLGSLVRGMLWRLLYVVVLVAVVFGTSSATFVSLAVGFGWMMISMRGRRAAAGAMILAAIVGLGFATGFDFDRYVFWGKSEQDIKTGSGRLLVWEWVIREKVSEKPVLGYGFGVGETLARMSDPRESTLQMMHMHSAGMSALANLGGVGLFLLLMTMLGVGKGAWKLSRARAGPALVGATAAVFVNSQMIASVTSTMSAAAIGHGLFFSMVAVSCFAVRRHRVNAQATSTKVPENAGNRSEATTASRPPGASRWRSVLPVGRNRSSAIDHHSAREVPPALGKDGE